MPADAEPTPVDAVRVLLSERIAALDAAALQHESRVREGKELRLELGERLEHAEVICRHIVNNPGRFSGREADDALQSLVRAREEGGRLDELLRNAGERLAEIGQERNLLVHARRLLDEVPGQAVAPSPGDDAARFRSASRQVFQIIEEERMRIARDMHDGPAQSMANLVLQAEVLERLMERDPRRVLTELADFKAGVRDALDETRNLIFDLRPMTLDDLGLVPTLRKFVKEFGDKNGITVRFHVVGEERRLPGNYEAVLFRIVQEALTNVRKHARARVAEVTLTLQEHRVVAVVRDDGEGFDVAATEARLGRTRNLGLISMRERADLEKGVLEIRSQVGRGSEVRVTFDI